MPNSKRTRIECFFGTDQEPAISSGSSVRDCALHLRRRLLLVRHSTPRKGWGLCSRGGSPKGVSHRFCFACLLA